MNKKDYENSIREVKDALGHKLSIGDLVVAHIYSNLVGLHRVIKICSKTVKLEHIQKGHFIRLIQPDKVVKIKEGSTDF